MQVSASPSVLGTTVHWKFDESLEAHVKNFEIEVFPDMFHDQVQVDVSPASCRATIITGLASGTAYSVRVIAVYCDDTRAESDAVHFTNSGIHLRTSCIYVNGMLNTLGKWEQPHWLWLTSHCSVYACMY